MSIYFLIDVQSDKCVVSLTGAIFSSIASFTAANVVVDVRRTELACGIVLTRLRRTRLDVYTNKGNI